MKKKEEVYSIIYKAREIFNKIFSIAKSEGITCETSCGTEDGIAKNTENAYAQDVYAVKKKEAVKSYSDIKKLNNRSLKNKSSEEKEQASNVDEAAPPKENLFKNRSKVLFRINFNAKFIEKMLLTEEVMGDPHYREKLEELKLQSERCFRILENLQEDKIYSKNLYKTIKEHTLLINEITEEYFVVWKKDNKHQIGE